MLKQFVLFLSHNWIQYYIKACNRSCIEMSISFCCKGCFCQVGPRLFKTNLLPALSLVTVYHLFCPHLTAVTIPVVDFVIDSKCIRRQARSENTCFQPKGQNQLICCFDFLSPAQHDKLEIVRIVRPAEFEHKYSK